MSTARDEACDLKYPKTVVSYFKHVHPSIKLTFHPPPHMPTPALRNLPRPLALALLNSSEYPLPLGAHTGITRLQDPEALVTPAERAVSSVRTMGLK